MQWCVVFKIDGSPRSPALVAPANKISLAAEDFFGSTGPYGGLNDHRASIVHVFDSKQEAIDFVYENYDPDDGYYQSIHVIEEDDDRYNEKEDEDDN